MNNYLALIFAVVFLSILIAFIVIDMYKMKQAAKIIENQEFKEVAISYYHLVKEIKAKHTLDSDLSKQARKIESLYIKTITNE